MKKKFSDDISLLKKFIFFQSFIILILFILLFLLYLKKDESDVSSKTENSPKTVNVENDYDVSFMNSVTTEQLVTLIESKKNIITFIGRDTCSVCKSVIPTIKKLYSEYNIDFYYLDITTVDRTTDSWKKLVSLMNVKTSVTVNESGTNKNIKETYGYLMNKYGFTPCVAIFNKGAMVNGKIGYFEQQDMASVFDGSGILKK